MTRRHFRSDDRVSVDLVTILIALEASNAIALASDSAMLITDDVDNFTTQQALPKIWEHPSNPDLLWGFTGDGAVGAQFGDWLRAESPDSWNGLLPAAGEKLARLNKEGKRLARIAGALKQFEAVGVLMVGYLGPDRESKVISMSSAGAAYPIEPGHLAVCAGSHAQAAALASWAAAWKIAPDADAAKVFTAVLESTIDTIPALGGPIQLKVITATLKG